MALLNILFAIFKIKYTYFCTLNLYLENRFLTK
jgi:hypothetical protein